MTLTIFDTKVNVRYEPNNDILMLHAEGANMKNAYGQEGGIGILVFRNARTDKFMGITVLDTCKDIKKREEELKKLGVCLDLGFVCGSQTN